MCDAPFDVTVVLSAYNLAPYLPACLDGLTAQTHQRFDVLLIDDASPDDTLAIARAYQSRMPGRLTVRTLPVNTGLAARVRNMALQSGEIRGEYVLFLDGDDLLEPDCIARLIAAARGASADMVVCAFDRLREGSRRPSKPELAWLAGGRGIRPEAGDLAFINTALWNKLIRRDVIADTRMPEIRVGEDALFLLLLYGRCERFAFVEKPLLHYRVRAMSAMARADISDITQLGDAFARLYKEPCARAMRDTIAASAFLHIGLSMALRAAANPAVSPRAFAAWANALFHTEFGSFKGVRSLGARALFRRGRAGRALYLAKWVYRLGLAPVMVRFMRLRPRLAGRWARW